MRYNYKKKLHISKLASYMQHKEINPYYFSKLNSHYILEKIIKVSKVL